MSMWNHSICEPCWKLKNGERIPVAINEEYRHDGPCCYCGKTHRSGIFLRGDPQSTPCKGKHPEPAPTKE